MKILRRILTDARFALRLLRRAPAFSLLVIGMLGAGIGATTAMFSLVSALFLRPLPYPAPEELSVLWATQPLVDPSPISLPDFQDWRGRSATFASMAAVEYSDFSVSFGAGPAEIVKGAGVSADFFSVMGISPLHGRLLAAEDDRLEGPKVAVISAALWRQRFGGDPAAVGKSIVVGGEPYLVVGIAPEGFRFSGPRSNRCDLWAPLAVMRAEYARFASDRGSHAFHAIGRRRSGVSLEQARAELRGIAKTLEATYPDTNLDVGARVESLQEDLVGSSRRSIELLFGAVGLVFLVVCANVTGLLLARAAGRRHEMAARIALGATRGRLVAQLLTETGVLFLVSAVLGVVLARAIVETLAQRLIQNTGALTIDVAIDGRGLAFALGGALVTGLLAGLAPALEASRATPHAILKVSGTRASGGRVLRLVRAGLVVVEVALALALVTLGTGLVRSYAKTAAEPPGFDPDNVAVGTLALPLNAYRDDAAWSTFAQKLVTRVSAVPGVESVALTSGLPMSYSNWNGGFEIEGRPPPPRGSALLERTVVTPGYFSTMKIPLLRGRGFSDEDGAEGRRVMVINQAAAEQLFPGEDPIGHRIDWGNNDDDHHEWREVVGIVGNVRRYGLGQKVPAESYVPWEQQGSRWMTVVARSSRAASLLGELPKTMAGIDPNLAMSNRRLLRSYVDDSTGPQRFTASLLGGFAIAALALAAAGLFGLVAYSTSRRTRELGIRVALGASPSQVVGLVMGEGLLLLAAGLGLGGVTLLVVSRTAPSLAPDPSTAFGVVALVGLAGALASFLPAKRAATIPPAIALRYE